MACPRTAATLTIEGSRSQRYPSWQEAIQSSKPGLAGLGSGSSPGTPSALKRRRSIPAEKDGPTPRTTTTRTSGGSAAPMPARPRHIEGVMALRRAARSRVMVAPPGAGWPTSSRRPAAARSGSPLVMLSPGARPSVPGPQRLARALPRVAPPRPRSETPFSDRMRCTNP